MHTKTEPAADTDHPTATHPGLPLVEAEQRMIAYAIHDGILQEVIAAKMCAEAHLAQRQGEPPGATAPLRHIVELLGRAIDEGRSLLGRLQPLELEPGTLRASLLRWARELEGGGHFVVHWEWDLDEQHLPAGVEDAVWRIVREALTNALRHSGQNQARVRLWQDAASVQVEVVDSGRGFDLEQVPKGHYGLEAIRQRAALQGGEVRIHSQPGWGTQVHVRLSLGNRNGAGAE